MAGRSGWRLASAREPDLPSHFLWRGARRRRGVLLVLRNWSLGATVTFGFASLLAMMAALIALAVHEVDLSQAQRRLLAEEVLPAAAAANRLAVQTVRFDAMLQA